MSKVVLPEPLVECHRCGGELERDDRTVSCSECDGWFLVQGDPEQSLSRFDLVAIVEHARDHPPACECSACLYTRREAEGYA
ncbi:hypothetical protein RYH80_20070 [Halobaculum sp. MBLA0147]|uniref:hypothetical protein n=1 Tax=Halobaculum sp. MBLA0147 TaxID=3079934 RepID=UPI0035245280